LVNRLTRGPRCLATSEKAQYADAPLLHYPLPQFDDDDEDENEGTTSVWLKPESVAPRRPFQRKGTVCGLNGSPPRLANSQGHLPFKSSDPSRLRPRHLRFQAFFRGALLALRFRLENMQPHFFSFESSELQPKFRSSEFALRAETGASNISKAPLRGRKTTTPSSHCSSVQERLVTYGSEALDTAEHLGLILGSQKAADALLEHFGSLTVLGSRLGSGSFVLRFPV